MPTLLANMRDPVILHQEETLVLTWTPGGSARLTELDASGRTIGQTTYTLSPSIIGPFPLTRLFVIEAVNGTITYQVSVRDESLQESRSIAQSGAQLATINNTSEQVLVTIPIPAGILGPNGVIKVSSLWSMTNNANVKTLRVRLGGAAGTAFWAVAGASLASLKGQCQIHNRASLAAQVGADAGVVSFGTSTNAVVTGTVDMSVAQDLVISAQKATGTDTVNLESYQVEVCPSV